MDVGQSLRFVFADKKWIEKVLIGGIILLVSMPLTLVLVGFLGLALVAGYSLDVLRNLRAGVAQPLPEWRDRWGEWLVDGLKLLLVLLAWSLPLILLNVFTGIGDYMVGMNNGAFGLFGAAMLFGASALSLLWGIVVALATPAIYLRLAETRDMASGFQFNDMYVWTRDHLGDVVIAVILAALFSLALLLIASLLGLLLCGIGVILTVPAASMLALLVTVHLYSQIGRGRPAAPTTSVSTDAGPKPPAESQPKKTTMVVGPDGTIIVTPTQE